MKRRGIICSPQRRRLNEKGSETSERVWKKSERRYNGPCINTLNTEKFLSHSVTYINGFQEWVWIWVSLIQMVEIRNRRSSIRHKAKGKQNMSQPKHR